MSKILVLLSFLFSFHAFGENCSKLVRQLIDDSSVKAPTMNLQKWRDLPSKDRFEFLESYVEYGSPDNFSGISRVKVNLNDMDIETIADAGLKKFIKTIRTKSGKILQDEEIDQTELGVIEERMQTVHLLISEEDNKVLGGSIYSRVDGFEPKDDNAETYYSTLAEALADGVKPSNYDISWSRELYFDWNTKHLDYTDVHMEWSGY